MLAPMAPHVSAELWERRGAGSMLATESWPEYDPDLVVESTVTMVVQVNGKVRDRIDVPADITPKPPRLWRWAPRRSNRGSRRSHQGDRPTPQRGEPGGPVGVDATY